MVGGGVTVVGVAVGDCEQVQVAEGVGAAVVVYDDDGGAGGEVVVDASAEFETNRTVKLVTASAVLANPAIFARFVIFKAVTRCLLGCDKNRARGQ